MKDVTMRVLQVDYDANLEPFTFEDDALAVDGIELVSGHCVTADDVVEKAAGATVLWLSWKPGIDRAILERVPDVELVIRWGVGYDQIDVDAATDLGVAVANAPDYGTTDVAEHVMGLLLSGARHIPWYDRDMKDGAWPEPQSGVHHRIHGRTLGLLGLGRIGLAVAERARGFGLTVLGHDPYRSDEHLRAAGIEPVGIESLLARSDYISLHTPLTSDTRHLIAADTIASMKEGAALINASRGLVVDTPALLDALDSGHLSWAALDVYEAEPLAADSPLRTCPHVILTPHLAGFSEEAWSDLRAEMCLTTRQWKQTGWADRVINREVRPRLRDTGRV